MLEKLKIEGPGKVNLHLNILGKRSDAYHDLESIFLALDWGDSLDFEVLNSKTGKSAGFRRKK